MDQLVCMRSFARVADLHSFTKAADALGLSRAVVSTHVADLEKHLRCQLLQRTTRRVGLTADGAEYLTRCQRILASSTPPTRPCGARGSRPRVGCGSMCRSSSDARC